MPAYALFAYDVTDGDAYSKYNPGSMDVIVGAITRHGGKILSVGGDATWVADARAVTVLLEFPSVEAALAMESDEQYLEARAIRHGSTGGRIELVMPGFVPPE